MALMLESIHQPMNDFFLSQFKTDASSPVHFRFDKFGSVVSDEDFLDPNHAELGYLPALAIERFSDLVNHIPRDAGDGVNIALSADSIDTAYFYRLLIPANPHFPDGADEATKDAVTTAFGAIKDQAQKLWSSLTLESITGLMLRYKPSTATPANWYDCTKKEVWTPYAFKVSGPSAEPAGPPPQLWKLKVSDQFLNAAMLAHLASPPGQPAPTPEPAISPTIHEMHVMPGVAAAGSFSAMTQPVRRFDVAAVGATMAMSGANVDKLSAIKASATAGVTPDLALRKNYIRRYHSLDLSSRLLLNQYVQSNQPTQPAKTNDISISFDYCLVKIRRPWYMDAFINDRNWYIPGVAKGDITTAATPGNLSFLPTGFVAIRNLAIEANWSADDIASAASATDFGPFKVTADVVNNKISHSGLQIVGWMVQAMPDLPPNDAGP